MNTIFGKLGPRRIDTYTYYGDWNQKIYLVHWGSFWGMSFSVHRHGGHLGFTETGFSALNYTVVVFI